MSISSPDPVPRLVDGITYMRLSDDTPSLPPPGQPPSTDEELEAFRKEWRQEVQAKKHEPQANSQVHPLVWNGEPSSFKSQAGPSSEAKARTLSPRRPTKLPSPQQPIHALPPLAPAAIAAAAAGTGPSTARRPRKVVEAEDDPVAIYAQAVEHEQSGKLNDALRLYRRAFKLDDSVDKLYARSVARAQAQAQAAAERDTTPTSTSADIVSPSAPAEQPYSFQRHIQLAPDYERRPLPPPGDSVASGDAPVQDGVEVGEGHPSQLSNLFKSRPEDITTATFLPAEEDLPLPIASLPSELLDPIFAHLDVASLERFALTCWRARYVTAASEVWRRLAEGIYRAPAMVPDPRAVRELGRRHRGEWRSVVVEEERVRMDGCYISVCHYVRPGAGDQWVAITHMITYHRFLRFYPDGTVISFLTTDHPSDVVPSLRPSLRAKGLHIGRWRLIRSDDPSHPSSSHAAQGKHPQRAHARVVIDDLVEPPSPGLPPAKYEFSMELSLRETGRGRWNKLDILDYRSINLATEESLSLSLKHQKPFYFSKVMYYHPRF